MLPPGANVIKLFYRGNLLQFHGNNVILCYKTKLLRKLPQNGTKLPRYLTLEKVGLKVLR